MLRISSNVAIADSEIEISAVRAAGPGGQNVNKVASAIHLRFDIGASSLPEFYKRRLLVLGDRRISREGVIVIKAQQFRTREKNLEAARGRLQELVKSVAVTRKRRIPTRATAASGKRRLDSKTRRGKQKALRTRVRRDDD
jgi:ribosome-associated protein